jgi:diketogulonate reductase-like aldo/keto reductase
VRYLEECHLKLSSELRCDPEAVAARRLNSSPAAALSLSAASSRQSVSTTAFARASSTSPISPRKPPLESCDERGITLEAYSTLGTGSHLRSDTVAQIAQRRGRTPAQVLLRWCIERGIPVIPKSTDRERIAENGGLFDFGLSDEDVAELDALDRTGGSDRALERRWWRS